MKQDFYEQVIQYVLDHQEHFYRLAFSYVLNQEDALDVVQESVCKALEHYQDLRDEKAVKTWMYRIVVNESLTFLKKKKRLVSLDEEKQPELKYEEERFFKDSEVFEYLGKLNDDAQKIIRLRFFEELSLKEIAEVMELNLNTVKAKLYRGLDQLKRAMKEMKE